MKKSKIKKVMNEFSKWDLKSSSGDKVTDPKQAVAIAYSEAGAKRGTDTNKFNQMQGSRPHKNSDAFFNLK